MFKVNNRKTRTTLMTFFWCFYFQLWTYFTPFSSVSIVDFEQESVSWDALHKMERSSCSQVFYRTALLKIFLKFTEKHLRWRPFYVLWFISQTDAQLKGIYYYLICCLAYLGFNSMLHKSLEVYQM